MNTSVYLGLVDRRATQDIICVSKRYIILMEF